jgi:hypothetical protein
MKVNKLLALIIPVFFVFMSLGLILAQEQAAQPREDIEVGPDIQNEPDIFWAWGEIVTLDPLTKSFTIRYLNYETDQEKEIVIATDDNTTYENIKSIDELKPKDTVSVDYVVSSEGRNIATNVGLELPEALDTAGNQVLGESAGVTTDDPATPSAGD